MSIAEQIEESIVSWLHRIIKDESFSFVETTSPCLALHYLEPNRAMAGMLEPLGPRGGVPRPHQFPSPREPRRASQSRGGALPPERVHTQPLQVFGRCRPQPLRGAGRSRPIAKAQSRRVRIRVCVSSSVSVRSSRYPARHEVRYANVMAGQSACAAGRIRICVGRCDIVTVTRRFGATLIEKVNG